MASTVPHEAPPPGHFAGGSCGTPPRASAKLWLCDFSGGPSLDLDGGSSSVIVTALASVREGLPTVEGAEQRTLADDEDLGLAVRLDACGDCFWCLADCPP